jgi:hypothetical protein
MSKRLAIVGAAIFLWLLGGPSEPLSAQNPCGNSAAPAPPTGLRILSSLLIPVDVAHAQTDCFPTPSSTGVPPGTNLTTVSSATLSTPGQVMDGWLVTGTVTIAANNVVIRNSEIRGGIHNRNGESFTIEDSTVGPTSGCNGNDAIGYSNYTARRVRLRNFGDGFRVSGSNILIEDSYMLLCSNPGDHSDGVQGYGGGTNVTVRHNTIDQRNAQDVTSPIFFADNSRSATVENNLLAGGGYTLRIHDDANPDIGPWRIVGNRLVDQAWQHGAKNTTNTQCTASTMTWSDNRLVTIDSGYNILSLGATVGC